MENLEVGFDPGSWDMLAHRMDYNVQQELDQMLEDRLGSLKVPMTPKSWEAMEQMIEAEEAADMIESEASIDNIAYEKLNDIQVPYKDHHWALMAKRLEEEFSLRHQLYRYKVAEMALMALLLLTIVRFVPMIEGMVKAPSLVDQQPMINQGQRESQSDVPADLQTLTHSSFQNGIAAGIPIASLKSNTSHPLFLSVVNDQSLFNPDGGSISETVSISGTSAREDEVGALSKTALLPLVFSNNSRARVEKIAEKNNKQFKFMAGKRLVEPDVVASLPLVEVNSSFVWELPTVKTRSPKKHGELRFGIFTTTDFNYVTTPPNQITVFGESVKTERNETMASGYGGGVNVSWKRDRWEYQTGGIYSFKRYIPNTPIFIFDTPNFFIKEDFNGIQLDIFQVPLNALYHFKNTGKWHFYTSIGASAHFVTATVYEINHKVQALRVNPGTTPDEGKSITDESSSSLSFPEGLLDGGKFHGNFYLTANLGIGVERYLSPKWTVFFQPNYQHFLMSQGIGDNKDKIYTTSFYLGTKFNLK